MENKLKISSIRRRCRSTILIICRHRINPFGKQPNQFLNSLTFLLIFFFNLWSRSLSEKLKSAHNWKLIKLIMRHDLRRRVFSISQLIKLDRLSFSSVCHGNQSGRIVMMTSRISRRKKRVDLTSILILVKFSRFFENETNNNGNSYETWKIWQQFLYFMFWYAKSSREHSHVTRSEKGLGMRWEKGWIIFPCTDQ